MLLLTRKPLQSFFIGKDIKVTILSVKDGHVVKIGIEAPQNMPIDREEIFYKKLIEGVYED